MNSILRHPQSHHFTIFDHNLYLIHMQAALSKIWVIACYSRRIVANRSICTLMKEPSFSDKVSIQLASIVDILT